MKRAEKTIILVLAAIAGSCVVSGLIKKQNISVDSKFDTKRVVFIAPNSENRYWTLAEKGIEAAAEKYGISIKIKEPLSNSDNNSEIFSMLSETIATKTDAIIIRGEENKDLISQLETAREKGILIGFIDSDNTDFSRDFYVGTDNMAAGETLAQNVLEIVGENASIGILSCESAALNLREREKGFRDICSLYPNVSINVEIDEQASKKSARDHLLKLAEKKPDAIVALEGYGTLAISTMLDGGQLEDSALFGVDYDSEHYENAVKDGQITGILTQQPYKMGYTCIENLYHLWKNDEVSDTTLIPTEYIDKNNVETFVEEGL